MPQLNPAPWLMILLFSWLVFLTIVPNKVMMYTSPNEITTQDEKLLGKNLWNWPWY
uniref:ATP synthase complex subunit 8 n=1 Tax=Grammatobothus polyophthalmus TaxID=1609333 RepID=A0A5J6DV17_9PLEU|nr:ATP synthase F0 subunit 8 [Grammatobothus polyophthalmus]QES95364.1 ATP synthase F0 subunit 8 [Grammatobothus polyophthalmus]